MLSRNNLSFGGQSELIGEVGNGNFLSMVELIAKTDPFFKSLIGKLKHSVR